MACIWLTYLVCLIIVSGTASSHSQWGAHALPYDMITSLVHAGRRALRSHSATVTPALLHMARDVFCEQPGYAAGLWCDMRLTSQPWSRSDMRLHDIQCPTLVVQVRVASQMRDGCQ
jgi:hypothetical protein